VAVPKTVTAAEIPFASNGSAVGVAGLVEQAGVFNLRPSSMPNDVSAACEHLYRLLSERQSNPSEWEQAKAFAVRHCRETAVQGYRGIVSAILKRPNVPEAQQSDASLVFADDQPADVAVPGGTLVEQTAALVRRHVVLSEAKARTIALWVAASYVIDALPLMPFLLITAPTMRAGKSTLLTLLSSLVARSMTASNMSAAVLVRAIAKYRPTVLADEADTWLTDEKSELRGIMNAGHTRQSAVVIKCHPTTLEPQAFPCFAPRVIAMIGRPAGTITDRSIAIELTRKRSDEPVERMRVDRLNDTHQPLRSQWRRWANDHLHRMRESDPEMPSTLNDRAMDNWRPLIAVAELVGGAWPAVARSAAVELSGVEDAAEEDITIELLRDIRMAFDGEPMVSSADLVKALVEMTDRPWAEWSHGKPMTAAKLASRLKRFNIRTRKVRLGAKTANTYHAADFHDAWARYLPIDSEQPEHTNKTGPLSTFSGLGTHGAVPTHETGNLTNEIGLCSDCSESKPEIPGPADGSDPVALPVPKIGGGRVSL
jgi:putative DNA primase/helicase